jgi:hypothetical protein
VRIDYGKIRAAFPGKAWVYAEQYDGVRIGKWDGESFLFYQPLEEEYLLLLRVFDEKRELKFTGAKCRDTADYAAGDFIPELAEARYYMYGERDDWRGDDAPKAGFTPLWEERGGGLYFPAALSFPQDAQGRAMVSLKLGMRNFARYNPVPVLPKGEGYDAGLGESAAGALEAVDYGYAGFYYADGKAVEL